MDTTNLTVFLSSKMVELAAERTALYDLLTSLSSEALTLKAWAYERDAVASNNSIRDQYLKILEQSALYIGLFWKAYGEWTIDEFNKATAWHMDRLLFVKADDDKNRDPALQKFLTDVAPVSKGLAPAWFKDEAELCQKAADSLKAWIKEKLTYRPGSSHAVLATDPDDVPHQPRKLIGRDDLLAQIAPALASGQRVLLKGFGGMGKTALAATAAADFMKSNPGPLLWLEIGKETPDILFEALARPFNASQIIAKEHGDAKIKTMKALLRQAGVKLLVLDNAWDGPALKTVLEAVPRDLPVIVTSRHAYPLDVRLEVDELTPASATETLAFYAGNPALVSDPTTAELCKLLGHLPFALEIAGKQLMVDRLTVTQLKTHIESAPAKMNMPFSFSQEGRRSVGDLLEISIEALDNNGRRVFMDFGAFFAPQVTSQMLQLYFDNESSASKIVETALDNLLERGLVERVDANAESVTAYRVHDLAHSYLKAQLDESIEARALDACLTYMGLHNQPALENFAALLPELDNLMGAATWAYQHGHDTAVENFAWNLASAVGSQFTFYRGYYGHAARLLQNAAHAAERQGNPRNQGAHLGNLGLAYFSLGDYPKAIDFHTQALAISKQIGDKRAEGQDLGNLGLAYDSLGDYPKAIDFHTQALAISKQIGDKRGEGQDLGNLGLAYANLGDYPKAIDFYQQALAISKQIGDKRGEGNRLGNLGNAYFSLGDYPKAIDFHTQALAIARQIGDKYNEGNQLGNLGNAYFSLGDYPKAIDFYQQALAIARRIGDRLGEGNRLNNLGVAYENLGEYHKAIEHYQQARAIFVAIGVQHLVEQVDQNIARAQAKLAGHKGASPSRKKGFFRR